MYIHTYIHTGRFIHSIKMFDLRDLVKRVENTVALPYYIHGTKVPHVKSLRRLALHAGRQQPLRVIAVMASRVLLLQCVRSLARPFNRAPSSGHLAVRASAAAPVTTGHRQLSLVALGQRTQWVTQSHGVSECCWLTLSLLQERPSGSGFTL